MSSLRRRLERLEAGSPGPIDEEAEKHHWLAVARVRRNREKHDPDEFNANDLFRLLRLQDRLGTTTEEVHAQLLSWRTKPPAEWAVRCVVAKAIYEQEEGTENMVCPPEWREAFVAADELRERHARVPEETLARWAVMQHEIEHGEPHALAERIAAEGERYGITDELFLKALGPDADEITDEEIGRRTREILAEDYYGERGYLIQKHIDRLMDEKGAA